LISAKQEGLLTDVSADLFYAPLISPVFSAKLPL